MTNLLTATSGLFKDRDFFVHDGTRLRRFRISGSLQIVGFVALMALVAWSSYALARFLTPTPSVASPSYNRSDCSPTRSSPPAVHWMSTTKRRGDALQLWYVFVYISLFSSSCLPPSFESSLSGCSSYYP